jgi:hypothetical protein
MHKISLAAEGDSNCRAYGAYQFEAYRPPAYAGGYKTNAAPRLYNEGHSFNSNDNVEPRSGGILLATGVSRWNSDV